MIIAITGGDRSGKTWLANKLSEDLGWPVRSFATPLKEAARILFGYDDDKKEQVHPDFGKTHRQLIVELATHLRSTYRDDFFARIMPKFGNVIIDDLRFMVEYEHLKYENLLVISVGDNVTEVQKSDVMKATFHHSDDYDEFLSRIKVRYLLRRVYIHIPSYNCVYASNESEADLYLKYFNGGSIITPSLYYTNCRRVSVRITDGHYVEEFYAFVPASYDTEEYLQSIKPGWKVIE